MRRRRQEEPPAGAPLWVVTYGDMMSLLLTFFIMLFAFSSVDMARFREALISLQGALGVLSGGPKLLNPGDLPYGPDDPSQMDGKLETRSDLIVLKAQLENYLADRGLTGKVHVEMTARGLLIRFNDTVLFDLGRADLRRDSKELLDDMAKFIGPVENEVMVEGHTDNIPLRVDAQFPTNWELSTARATTVVRYFVEDKQMRPSRFYAAGYSEYRPVVPNNSNVNRALNRRVDLVIIAAEDGQLPGV